MRAAHSPRTSARRSVGLTSACLVVAVAMVTMIIQSASIPWGSHGDAGGSHFELVPTVSPGETRPAGGSVTIPPSKPATGAIPGGAPGIGAVSEADGALPDGVTVFDDRYAGVANLNPELLKALRQAATDAANDGIEFYVTSGWRSEAYQEQLFRDAVAEYGSAEEAARWVAPPTTSAHLTGDAVDIGPSDAADWLSEHGADYGLCQVYDNEPWHYELRRGAAGHGCPATYADAAHDPRLQP